MPTHLNILDAGSFSKSPRVTYSKSGITRRKSLLTRRSSSRNAAAVDSLTAGCYLPATFSNLKPIVPMELLEQIIEFYSDSVLAAARFGREPRRAAFFKYVKPLTVVSRDLRYLVLRQFCKMLGFNIQQEADGLFEFLMRVTASFNDRNALGGFVWVRAVSMPAFLIPKNAYILKQFTNLRRLDIDCSHCSLLSQVLLSRHLGALVSEKDAVPNLLCFTVTNLPQVDENLLKMIAQGFPQLTDLHVSAVEGIDTDCCQNCYEDSLSRVMHSPIQVTHPTPDMLATGFADALKSLSKLKTLHLGIFLSRFDLLEKHTTHGGNDVVPCTVKSINSCRQCTKYEKETKHRELATSLSIARSVESLEFISWASAFSPNPLVRGKEPEHNSVECSLFGSDEDMTFHPTTCSQPRQTNESGGLVKSQDPSCNSHWNVAGFAIRRTAEKIRLTRTP